MFRSMWCNIRKWRNNYRVYIAFLAVAVFTYIRKYSLQGTTQSRYLTGGVPPVRFSM